MAGEKIICHGAKVTCKYSKNQKQDKIKSRKKTKVTINDKDGSEKYVITDKEIGKPFENNSFGECLKNLTPSGQPMQCEGLLEVTEYQGAYKKVTYEDDGGHPLTEKCTATCAMGTPGCITFVTSGQKAEASKHNKKNANDTVMAHLYPYSPIHKEEVLNIIIPIQ